MHNKRTSRHIEPMTFTVQSRRLGHSITFSRPGGHYIYVDLSEEQNRPGTLGQQMCWNGELRGVTASWDGDRVTFERLCRNWLRSYYKKHVED